MMIRYRWREKMTRIFLTIIVSAMAVSVWGVDLPREAMPDRVYAILQEAIAEHYAGDEANHGLALNREGLDELHSKMVFPDYSQLEFLRLHHRRDKTLQIAGWGKRLDNGGVQMVMDDWTEKSDPAVLFSEIQVCDFKEELRKARNWIQDQYNLLRENPAAIQTLRRNRCFPLISDDRGWVFWRHLERPEPMMTDLLFQCAYASAYWGETDIAKTCLRIVLLMEPTYLNGLVDRLASRAVDRGKQLLILGRPFQEVYEQWMVAQKIYGESQEKNELNALLDDIKPQVLAETNPPSRNIGDPTTLPLEERIEFYIDRLQETCEHPITDPPFYSLLQQCAPLIEIGTPAIDRLIDHLDDRRLTRTVYQDMGYGQVFRVRSVVSACIQKILGFMPDLGMNPVFQTELDSLPKEHKRKMKEWWAQYRNKSPVEWYTGQLEKAPIGGRIELLKKIEAIDPQSVDSVGLLKKWAAELNDKTGEQEQTDYKNRIETDTDIPPLVKGVLLNSGRYFGDNRLPDLANALAERGDLSLLPQMRAGLLDCLEKKQYVYPYVGYLIRYGTVDDYRDLYRRAQQEAREGYLPGSSKMIDPVFAAVESATHPLTVPILVSFLDRNEESGAGGHWYGDGRFSKADRAMEILLRRIPREVGFKKTDPMPVRREAIERWKQWWEREGKADFVKAHPEALDLWRE